MGIVTNGMADNQLGKLQRTGLADAVDGYAVSGVEGIRKPETGLFEIAAQRCGTSLAEGGWMVGDNLIADMVYIRDPRRGGLPWVKFAKGEAKLETMIRTWPRQAATGRSRVAAIGVAQEFALISHYRQRDGRHPRIYGCSTEAFRSYPRPAGWTP
ncbi:HAD family hydrolase [Nonomuraea basaltis]|uniref:HAD family hydrolase n=1 Tax=Nonomuraea basaltis TaxID=2495887 RepID=UPI001F0D70FE|nr:hypothetical protein [Nonomuraea basaltis]